MNEVHRKIREISQRTVNPRPAIAVSGIAIELMVDREYLLSLLVELEKLYLIQFNDIGMNAVRLTLLGASVKS